MKKLAFTLAEVLITLVIIGIVAAMTIPTLMQNTNAQEYRTGLKKAVSALNQALLLNYSLTGETAGNYHGTGIVNEVFKKRMATIDNDGFTIYCNGSSFTTADGMKYCVKSNFGASDADYQNSPCNSYNTVPCVQGASSNDFGLDSNMYVDVNGDKKPNRLTTSSSKPQDIYELMMYATKVLPWGQAAQEIMYDKESPTGGYGRTW